MPLFEITADESLTPFRRLGGGADLYESELESLLWSNIDDLTGESLFFRVARQPTVAAGGRPDLLALDLDAHVVVIEIKRDVDRTQLAQCLEYAGWARNTNLDELASLYHLGADRFFADWQQFTESENPRVISRPPRLLLVARDFQGRSADAFEFLAENGLPVGLLGVSLYQDQQGRRFLDVEIEGADLAEEEPVAPAGRTRIEITIKGRRVRISDLLDAGLLEAGQELIWTRPQLGQTYRAVVQENGTISLDDHRNFSSPSKAACEAAGIPAYDGWHAWTVGEVSLNDLRAQLVQRSAQD